MPTSLVQDLRWAARLARRRPTFTLAVTGTLAVSIAALSIAFALARAVLWRPLPFEDAQRLRFVWEDSEQDGRHEASRVTGARYAAWRDTTSGFSSLSLFGAAGFTMDGADGPIAVRGVRVSASFFDTLGIRPALGRAFDARDEHPGAARVIVLSHAFWREQFGGRVDAIGRTVRLSGADYTAIGVMPAVMFPSWPVNPATVTLDADSRQFWVPIPRSSALDSSDRAHVFGVVGRLASGVTDREVVARLDRTLDASGDRHRARMSPLREQFVSDARGPLLALGGAGLALLLVACANLAALFASGFESRRAEVGVRAAIGAGAGRLVQQFASEVLLLAGAAAAIGLAGAHLALAWLPDALPPGVPLLTELRLDWTSVGLAIGLAAAATAMLTAWPSIRLVASGTSAGQLGQHPRGRVHRAFVVAQLAVTLALVTAAGLLAQSLNTVGRRDPGFDVDHTLVLDVTLPAPAPVSAPRVAASERAMLAAIAAAPGVRAAASAYDHPLAANWSEAPALQGEGGADDQRMPAELRIVSPGYFEALGVQVLDGRPPGEHDTFDRGGVAVVNEAFARAHGGRVLGRTLRSGTPRFMYGDTAPDSFEIVGVVENERFRGLEQGPLPAFYLSTRQFPQTSIEVLVRTAGQPIETADEVRGAIRRAEPAATLDRVSTLDSILAAQLGPRRLTSNVIGGIAGAALLLAGLGVYGLLAMLVGARTREIGVRLAIGASPLSVARGIVGDGLRSAIGGIVLGSALALLVGQAIRSLLVEISPADPATLLAVAGGLAGVAAVAAIVPARRAARIDPAEALRGDRR